jgi:hypothetical protein
MEQLLQDVRQYGSVLYQNQATVAVDDLYAFYFKRCKHLHQKCIVNKAYLEHYICLRYAPFVVSEHPPTDATVVAGGDASSSQTIGHDAFLCVLSTLWDSI